MAIHWNSRAYEVLAPEQLQLTPLLEEFASTHVLMGGTAIALHIGHRKSIDFDLFCFGKQGTGKEFMGRIQKASMLFDKGLSPPFWLSDEEQSELTLFFGGVKVQRIDFSRNPFDVKVCVEANDIICGIPTVDLLTLGAFKVYAMMYRAKWKDAVDVAYIVKAGLSLLDIVRKTQEIFGVLYKPIYSFETITANQWDMTETVDYVGERIYSDEDIQSILEQAIKDTL